MIRGWPPAQLGAGIWRRFKLDLGLILMTLLALGSASVSAVFGLNNDQAGQAPAFVEPAQAGAGASQADVQALQPYTIALESTLQIMQQRELVYLQQGMQPSSGSFEEGDTLMRTYQQINSNRAARQLRRLPRFPLPHPVVHSRINRQGR